MTDVVMVAVMVGSCDNFSLFGDDNDQITQVKKSTHENTIQENIMNKTRICILQGQTNIPHDKYITFFNENNISTGRVYNNIKLANKINLYEFHDSDELHEILKTRNLILLDKLLNNMMDSESKAILDLFKKFNPELIEITFSIPTLKLKHVEHRPDPPSIKNKTYISRGPLKKIKS